MPGWRDRAVRVNAMEADVSSAPAAPPARSSWRDRARPVEEPTYAGATAAQLGIEQPDTPEMLDELTRVRPDDQEVSPLRSFVVGAKQLTPGAIESTLGPSSKDRIGGVPLGVSGKVAGAPGVAEYEQEPGEFDARNAEILEANEREAGASFRRNPLSHTAGNAAALLLGGSPDLAVDAGGAALRGAANRASAKAATLAERGGRLAAAEEFDLATSMLPDLKSATSKGNKAAIGQWQADKQVAKETAAQATDEARAAAAAEARTPTQDKSLAIFGLEDSPGQRYVRDPLEAAEQGRELYAMETPGVPGKPLHETLLEMPVEQRARYALGQKGEAGSTIGAFRDALPNVAGAEVAAAPLKTSVRKALVDLPQELKTEEIARLYGRIDEATNYKTVTPAALRDLIEETERLANATSDEALRRAYYSVRKVLVGREKDLIVRHFPEEAQQYLQALTDWQNWDDIAFGSKRLLEKGNRASTPQAASRDLVNWPAERAVKPTRPEFIPRPEPAEVTPLKFPGGDEALAAARAEAAPSLKSRLAARLARVGSSWTGGSAVPAGSRLGSALGDEIGRPISDKILLAGKNTPGSLMKQAAAQGDFAYRLRQIAGKDGPVLEAILERVAGESPARASATIHALAKKYPGLIELIEEMPRAAEGEGEGTVEPSTVMKSDRRAKTNIQALEGPELLDAVKSHRGKSATPAPTVKRGKRTFPVSRSADGRMTAIHGADRRVNVKRGADGQISAFEVEYL